MLLFAPSSQQTEMCNGRNTETAFFSGPRWSEIHFSTKHYCILTHAPIIKINFKMNTHAPISTAHALGCFIGRQATVRKPRKINSCFLVLVLRVTCQTPGFSAQFQKAFIYSPDFSGSLFPPTTTDYKAVLMGSTTLSC